VSRAAAGMLAAAVLMAGGSVFALSDAADAPPAEPTAVQQVPTSEATLACPESPQTKHTDTSLLAVSPPPDEASAAPAAGPGSLSVAALGDASTPIDSAAQAGVPVVRPLGTAPQPSVVVEAKGAMSSGASAFQWSVEDGKRHSGRAVSPCAAASDDWWFNGADTSVGSTSRVVLTNTTPAIAVVDVELFGPKGAVQTVGQRGIALAPDSRQSIDLSRFAQSLSDVSVHVHATAGLVTAAVESTRVDGVTPAGSEWLPAATAPSTSTVIDPAVGDSASQDLEIVNPSEVGALVQVQVVEDAGPFVPSGLENVRVPPQSVKTVPLGKISHNDPVAVRLTSTTPVTGAVISTAKGGADYAVAAPSPILADAAVVPVVPDVDLALELTGTTQQSTGQFRVTGYDRDGGQVFTDSVTIDGLRTTEWTQPDKAANGNAVAVYLVITASLEADVQAVATYSDKGGVASVPVVPGVFTVTRPSVTPTR
jgi:Family of unknown function (DUF5719)